MSVDVTDASVSMHGRGMRSLSPALSRSSHFAVWDDSPPASLTLWDVLSPLQVLSEGLINSIPEPAWSRNPFWESAEHRRFPSWQTHMCRYKQVWPILSLTSQPPKTAVRPENAWARPSLNRGSPTDSVVLTFSLSLEMAEVFITFSYFPVVSF